MPEQITESLGRLTEATGRQIRVDLITPGWGSSGYYAPQVLEAAGASRVFPAGTHMYLDHPTAVEAQDRPERSVRDLAAVTTSDAAWDPQRQALTAEARVFAPYQQLIAEMADAIGISIRAAGDITVGEAEGRSGRIVTALVESPGTSADFVTLPGRGGRITQLLESARGQLTEARNVGQHLESRLHQDFTNRADDMAANGHLTREERIHLSNAVGQGLSAFAAHLEANAPQLYQRDIYDEPTAPAVSEGAPAPTTNNHKEGLVPELTEAEVTALRDSASRAEAARDAALAEAAAAKTALAEHNARAAARPKVAAKVGESKTLAARTQARIVETVLAALPVTDGAIADETIAAATEAAVKAAEDELADYAPRAVEAFGAFGSQQAGAQSTESVSEADMAAYDAASARTFNRSITGA